jgi:hypothetical protein
MELPNVAAVQCPHDRSERGLEGLAPNCAELFWRRTIECVPTAQEPAMHLHTYRDESRSRHLDLIGGRRHPWSIDLVVVTASGILLMGFACAFAALLIR